MGNSSDRLCHQMVIKKHIEDHRNTKIKTYHFFNNKKECPDFEIGCKFTHEKAINCKFAQNSQVTKYKFRHD